MTALLSFDLPTVIVLASGRGERFRASGGETHKLAALLGGQPVLARTLDAVRASELRWHLEDAGHPGMGDSIAAAVRSTADSVGWLVLPGDLPLVRPETLRRVASALAAGAAAVQPQYESSRGHPVAFAADARTALLVLSGERGAASVLQALRARGEVLDLVVDDIGTVTDIDTLADLAAAEALLSARGISPSR